MKDRLYNFFSMLSIHNDVITTFKYTLFASYENNFLAPYPNLFNSLNLTNGQLRFEFLSRHTVLGGMYIPQNL